MQDLNDFCRHRHILLSLQNCNRSYQYKIYLFINHIYLIFCVGNTISVSLIEFLRKFCVHDETFDRVASYYVRNELLNLKDSKLGQILQRLFFADLVTF